MKLGLNVKLGIVAGLINCIAWFAFSKALGYYNLYQIMKRILPLFAVVGLVAANVGLKCSYIRENSKRKKERKKKKKRRKR